MQKRDRKLKIHRETLFQLDLQTLAKANGGVMYTGCDSACTECGGMTAKLTVLEPVVL